MNFNNLMKDKKILMGICGGGLLIIILIIVIIVSCMSAASRGDNNTQNPSEMGNLNNIQDSEDATLESTEDKTGTETETENDTQVGDDTQTGDDTQASDNTQSGDDTSSGDDSSSGEQLGTTTKPDGDVVVGTGTNTDPILEDFGDDLTVETIKIEAGKSAYYGIYGAGGLGFTINHPDAYVVYNGTVYEAQNGVVSFIVGAAMANEAVYFEIGNKGTTATEFVINFTNQMGSRQNPHVLTSISNVSKSLEEGDSVGYFYRYIAEKTGTIRFYIVSATKDAELSVTNNNTMASRTFEDEDFVKEDANGNLYYEIEVTKGDELLINVCAKPGVRKKYPATDVVWSGIFQ